MSLTAAEIRERVATDLGIARRGQAIQYDDQVRIDQGYIEVYARLKKDSLAIWPFSGEVPDEVVPEVVGLVCLNCSGSFSVSNERMQRILLVTGSKGDTALREIRKFVNPPHESTEEPTDY